jgi:ribonuclease HI
MLIHLPDSYKDTLLKLFNVLWEKSYCPKDWKLAWLKPILKSGKCPNEEQSYRPILYTSCVAKLFETILKRRMVSFIEQNKLLPTSQHGFRQGMNIQMCLADLVSAINLSFSKKQMHFVLLADIKGAFDNVPHTALLEELHYAGFPPKIIKWLEDFFTDRSLLFFSSIGVSHTRPLRKGVPQGGVLSPILYILYVRSLENHVRRLFLLIQFADDTLLHFSHHSMPISRNILREAIEALFHFFQQRGLELNPLKTIVMVFSKKKVHLSPIKTSIGDIEMKDTATYLGIKLDSQLNWKAHIDGLVHRCQMPLNIIKSVAYVWWGADPTCLLLIYKALILSKLQTSSFLWQQAAKRTLHKLDVIQNTAMRKILGVLPSTPIHSMLAETKLKPLKYVAMREADNLIIKLLLTGEHPALDNIKELSQREDINPSTPSMPVVTKAYRKWTTSGLRLRKQTHTEGAAPQNLSEIILDTPWNNFQKKELPPQTLQLICSFLNTEAKNYVKIYTDGSKQQSGETGTAIYSKDLNIGIIKRPPNTYSIFSAEALALCSALQFVREKDIKDPVLICTDSRSILTTLANLQSSNSKNFLVTDIRRLLREITNKEQHVHLAWVPSHIGLQGNEAADKLAQLSCQSDIAEALDTPTPDLKRQIAFDCSILWDTNWRLINQHKGKDYAQLFPNGHIPKTTWFAKVKGQTRSFYTSLGRLRFAHVTSPDRLYAWKVVSSPACVCSFSPGTLDHLLFACPRYTVPRQRLIACLAAQKLHPPFNLPTLLSTQNAQTYLALHDLYKEIFLRF